MEQCDDVEQTYKLDSHWCRAGLQPKSSWTPVQESEKHPGTSKMSEPRCQWTHLLAMKSLRQSEMQTFPAFLYSEVLYEIFIDIQYPEGCNPKSPHQIVLLVLVLLFCGLARRAELQFRQLMRSRSYVMKWHLTICSIWYTHIYIYLHTYIEMYKFVNGIKYNMKYVMYKLLHASDMHCVSKEVKVDIRQLQGRKR